MLFTVVRPSNTSDSISEAIGFVCAARLRALSRVSLFISNLDVLPSKRGPNAAQVSMIMVFQSRVWSPCEAGLGARPPKGAAGVFRSDPLLNPVTMAFDILE